MTKSVQTLQTNATVAEAARVMRDGHIGDIVVTNGKVPIGIVTDRDVVVRVVAEGKSPEATVVGDICTPEILALEPSASVGDAVRLMTEQKIRRVPVVKNGEAIGILSLGDLARAEDPTSALGTISAAPPTS
jgi:CBS domain-containing protein